MKLCFVLALTVLAFVRAAAAERIVLTHRGASGYLPEHSLPAKAMAHAQGADFVEQDLVLTKDGVPIVLHDIHLDTTTDVAQRFPGRSRPDGRYYAIDFTLAEIKQLHAVTRFDPKTRRAAYAREKSGRPQVSAFTRDAHAAGLQVHWGVVRRDDLPENCPSLDALHAALFVAAGTEGGFTDFPDLTVQWLKDHKLR